MTFLDVIDKYGVPLGLAILIIVALIPVVRDRLIPAIIDILKSRDAFQRQIELDRLASAKKTDENISALATSMVQLTAMIPIILQNQTTIQERENDILQTLNSAITSMRETVARREGYEQRKKDTGPLGEGK